MPSKSKKKAAAGNEDAAAAAAAAGAASPAPAPAAAAAAPEAVPPPSVSSLLKQQAAAAPTAAAAAAAGKVKRAPLLDAQDRLMPNVSTALLEIFGRFDDDGDGALSRKELEAFAIATNGEKFEDEAVDELKKSFNVDANDNLTKRGFLEMYQLQTLSDPNETWRDLIKHGYSVKVQLVRRATGNADPDWKAKQAALEKEREEKEKAEKEAKAKAEKEAKEAAKEKKAAEKAEKAAEKTDKGKAKKNGKAKA